MSRNFKLLSMLVVVLLVLSACAPGPGAMRGGGWMFAEDGVSKATFGFTGVSKTVEEGLETKGQFTYNDRSEDGIKFHGKIYFAGAEDNWGVLKGTFEEDGETYWFKARAKEYGKKDIGLEMTVWGPNGFYFNEGKLGGGTINFWPEEDED